MIMTINIDNGNAALKQMEPYRVRKPNKTKKNKPFIAYPVVFERTNLVPLRQVLREVKSHVKLFSSSRGPMEITQWMQRAQRMPDAAGVVDDGIYQTKINKYYVHTKLSTNYLEFNWILYN